MMKFIYSHVRSWKLRQDEAAVAFFFNARGVDLERTTIGLYRSLLFQILTAFPGLPLPSHVWELQKGKKDGKVPWALPVLQDLFQDVIQSLGQRRLICFIDALDECDEDQIWTMIDLFQELGNTAATKSTRFYICLSSRHYPRVEIQPCLRPTLEHQRGHTEDIEKYIHSKLGAMQGKAVEEVTALILNKAAGVFMWVVLVVEILRKEFRKGNTLLIKRRVHELPSKLSELFRDMLSRDQQSLDHLLLCFQWILFSKRPLTSEEFFYALHSGLHQEEPETLMEWDPKLVTEHHMDLFISSSSKGLAELTKSEEPRVQFIHESVRDFLIKDKGIQHIRPQHLLMKDFEAMSHDRLRDCCQFYLKVDISSVATNVESRAAYATRTVYAKKFPFLRYAVSNVFHHSNISGSSISQADFLNEFDMTSWICVHNIFELDQSRNYTPKASNAYIFAENNWVELLRLAIRSGADILSPHEYLRHPLIVASANGHDACVSLLLGIEGMSVQPQDSYGRTPLWWAVKNQHELVIDSLLELQGPNPSLADHNGRTPLMAAHERNNHLITKRLLAGDQRLSRSYPGHDVDLIICLAYLGFSLEELLSAGDAMMTVKNQDGETPLHVAIKKSDHDLLETLVVLPGIDPNLKDNGSRTALACAATQGNFQAVEALLVIRGIQVDSRDATGRTPLSLSTTAGDQSNLKKVLDVGYVNDTVRRLLGAKDVNVNSQDDDGRTPLSWAAAATAAGPTIELAVGQPDPNIQDKRDRTPLSWAAERGRLSTMEQLLKIKDADPDLPDRLGRTPLIWICASNQRGLRAVDKARQLILTGRVNVNF